MRARTNYNNCVEDMDTKWAGIQAAHKAVATRRRVMPSKISLTGSPSIHAPRRKDESVATGESFYTFVMFSPMNGWRYVHIHGHAMVLKSNPGTIFKNPNAAMLDLWQRAVIDRQVGADEGADMNSLRLVKCKVSIVDATADLFANNEEMDMNLKNALFAKLSDREAKALNMRKGKAMQKLHQRGPDPTLTNQILMRAAGCSGHFDLTKIIPKNMLEK